MRVLAVLLSMVAPAAVAENADRVFVNVTYLSEPTEWCASSVGVPALVTIDGPNVYGAELAPERPVTVRVRRGGERAENVEIGRVDPSQTRTRYGNRGVHVGEANPRVDELTPLGRLKGEVDLCEGTFSMPHVSGAWRIETPQGEVVRSGTTTDLFRVSDRHPLYGGIGRDYPKTGRIGGTRFVVLREPVFEYSTNASGLRAVEQDR